MSDSGTLPFFRQSTEELIPKLRAKGSPVALDLADKIDVFRQTFITWETKRPDELERLNVLRSYFDLARQAMDLITDSRPPPG